MSLSAAQADRSFERRPERGARLWVLWFLVACGGIAIVAGAWRMSSRSPAAANRRLGPGAAVMRGSRRVAPIERMVAGRGRARLPSFLAPAQGPTIDSARLGALAALLVASTARGSEPVVALVPRDSVRGLPLVARLVVTPGEPGLLVFGAAGAIP